MQDRMRYLCDKLSRYAYEYYVLDSPTVSDKEYDALYDELVRLEKSLGTVLENSPTRRVGGALLSGFKSVRHRVKLYSLDKAQNLQQLMAWNARLLKRISGEATFTVEKKYDGLTLSVLYSGGRFERAVTRGNGIIGEDVSEQVLTIKSLPLSIPFKGTVEIQGEGLMRLSVLERINKSGKGEPLKNARNAAAGSIRNLDTGIAAGRSLDIVVYGINYIDGLEFNSQQEIFNFLRENRFFVSDYVLADNIESAHKAVLDIEQGKDSLDFLIDGAVIKVNQISAREALGYTEKFPRWAVAYKFEAQEVTTTLKSVEWNVGRTGRLTPLAHLDAVELSGATVRRATLNNYRDIERKGVKLNARVLVRRSNEVIPEILGTTEYPPGSKDIAVPSNCPACGSALFDDGINLFCKNVSGCTPQIVALIEHFCSKSAMDIEGLSQQTAMQLYQNLGVDSVDKLYALTKQQLLTLEGFKEKKAHNILSGIEKSKDTTLARFIYALSIPNIGVKSATDLARKFGSLDAIIAADTESLKSVNDFGDIMAQSVIDYFNDNKNIRLLQNLKSYGVAIKAGAAKSGKCSGLKFVITGTISGFSRSDVKQIIENCGGEVMSSVSKSTDMLLCGESAGSKLSKAEELGVKVLRDDKLTEFIKGLQ